MISFFGLPQFSVEKEYKVMLNKIINLINYFRVTRNNLFRELKFFHEPAPKNISQIVDYKFKSDPEINKMSPDELREVINEMTGREPGTYKYTESSWSKP